MHIACSGVAQRVGFEPTCGFPQTDFEGHFRTKTAIFRLIGFYKLTPKTLYFQGFRRFVLLAAATAIQVLF